MITIPRSSLQLFLCSTVPTNEGGTRSSCVETSGWRRNEYSRYLYDFLSSSFSRAHHFSCSCVQRSRRMKEEQGRLASKLVAEDGMNTRVTCMTSFLPRSPASSLERLHSIDIYSWNPNNPSSTTRTLLISPNELSLTHLVGITPLGRVGRASTKSLNVVESLRLLICKAATSATDRLPWSCVFQREPSPTFVAVFSSPIPRCFKLS
jgi:hypothetical protein